MHELTLSRELIRIVEEMVVQRGFDRVEVLRLSCGRFSCVNPEALRFAFKVESSGTPAEGAHLEIDLLPAVVYCFPCGQERTVTVNELQCPVCGGWDVLLTGGTEELRLIEMEIAP